VARNLGELVLHATASYGDAVAFQVRRGFRIERLTFADVGLRARQTAAWLVARGLRPGDRVVVWSPNMPEYAVLYFGAWLAGVVVVPIDVRTKQDVADRFVAAAQPSLALVARSIGVPFGESVRESFVLEDLFDMVAGADPEREMPDVGPSSLCEIAFTSGTTGVPKGVMLTHGNLIAEIEGLRVAFPLERSYRALSLLPLSHIFEQAINLLLAYTSGVRMTYVPRVNSLTILRTLQEDRITCFVLVPELLRMLLAGLERGARQRGRERAWEAAHRVAPYLPWALRRALFRDVHRALGGSLDFIGSGSAPLDLKLASTFERMGIHIYEGYGLTEVAGAATINGRRDRRVGSVGRAIPGVEITTADDGEILIRGPTVTSGYFANTELTARAFRGEWFRTGDVGEVDGDGFLHISGREAFKIVLPDGRKVYPEDVEQALNSHPLVRESCVVGLPRPGGESVHAVLLTDHPERAGQIVRDANRVLSNHEQITSHSVWDGDDFPRTPILKIDRKAVRAAVDRHERAAGPALIEGTGTAADQLLAIVGRLAGRAPIDVRPDDALGLDLGLDSLGRVELVAAIEEEMGRVVDELGVGPATTVAELRRMVAAGAPTVEFRPGARWQRSWWARGIGRVLLWGAFRIQDRSMRLEIVHPELAARLPFPSIWIFNYQGPYAALAVLRAVPRRLRDRVAVATDSRLWEGRDRWQGVLAALAIQAFPFVKSGGAVRPSLEEMGRWLDDGYAVIMSPEGNPEQDGVMLPFLGGVGLMAVEMRVPIVPFRLEDYHKLFPRDPQFPYLPNRSGTARVIVGEPFTVPKTMPHDEASELARRALMETR